MQKKTQKLIIAGSLIGLIVIVSTALIVKARKKRKALEEGLISSADLAQAQLGSDIVNWPLRYGSGYINKVERPYVIVVQNYLNAMIAKDNVFGLSKLTVDGMFGTNTEKALLKIAGVKEVDMSMYNIYNTLSPTADSSADLSGLSDFLSKPMDMPTTKSDMTNY